MTGTVPEAARLHPDLRFRQDGDGCTVSLNGRWYSGDGAILDALRQLDGSGEASSASGSSLAEQPRRRLFEIGALVNALGVPEKLTRREIGTVLVDRDLRKLPPSGPLKVGIEITGHCNLSCSFCSASSHPATHMQWGMLLHVIDWCSDSGVFEVSVSGGEPFLYPQIDTLIRLLASRSAPRLLPMTTNGTAPFLRHLPTLAELGMRVIQISVPAVPEDAFKKHTGRTIHDAETAIGRARDAGLEPVISSVVFPQWLDSLLWVARFAAESGVAGLHLMGVVPIGRGEQFRPFRPKDAIQYFEMLLRVHERYPSLRLDFNTEFLPAEIHRATPSTGSRGCPAGIDQIYVMPDGVVYPCNVMSGMSDLKCGSLRTRRLDRFGASLSF